MTDNTSIEYGKSNSFVQFRDGTLSSFSYHAHTHTYNAKCGTTRYERLTHTTYTFPHSSYYLPASFVLVHTHLLLHCTTARRTLSLLYDSNQIMKHTSDARLHHIIHTQTVRFPRTILSPHTISRTARICRTCKKAF